MFNQGGLSMEQAPPVMVVLRFFVTASIFGVLLGVYIMGDIMGVVPTNEYSLSVIIVHLLALGVMASFMFGALFQMLPVIAGVVIKMPTKKSMVTNILLVMGLMAQLFAFQTSSSILYLTASILLGAGLLHASTLMLKELIDVKDHSSSSRGMLFALGSFVIAIILGVYMLLTLGGYIDGNLFSDIKIAHYSFALFGWITLLIISVSFQVVEMFYVTPKYPIVISQYLTGAIFSLLVLKVVALFSGLGSSILDSLIALLFIIYAGVTIHRLYKRRRPTSDATVWFWRFGMAMLILSMSMILISNLTGTKEPFIYISQISFIGFALSIVFAMVYKIVPFLVWFHLSNQGYMEAPMMFDVIHPKRAKVHFWIHISMILTWILSIPFINIIILLPILMIISFSWLLYHLVMAIKKYNYTQKFTEKIEW